jgi:hypothetical protein
MSGSLSCILPAVSMRTTSNPFSRAAVSFDGTPMLTIRQRIFGNTRGVFAIPPLVQLHLARAHLLKVSHAAMSTRSLFCNSQNATLDRFVDLPTPFTPTKVMAYGLGPSDAARLR